MKIILPSISISKVGLPFIVFTNNAKVGLASGNRTAVPPSKFKFSSIKVFPTSKSAIVLDDENAFLGSTISLVIIF